MSAPSGLRRLGDVDVGVAQPLQRRGVDDREVELLVGGAELVEQVEGLVDDPVRARAGAVDLVDHDDRLAGRAAAPCSVTKRVCGIGPSTASTSSSTPSTMLSTRSTSPPKSAWPGVSTMLMWRAAVVDRAVLGEDGDAALALDVVGVHHPLGDVLVRGEGAGLPQQLVDQRGLAVVDVGDDGDVAQGAAAWSWFGGRDGWCCVRGRQAAAENL